MSAPSSNLVMAEAGVQDVVNEAQSMGHMPIDVSGNTFTSNDTGEADGQPTIDLDHVATNSASDGPFLKSDAAQHGDFISYAKFDDSQRNRSPSNGKSHVGSDSLSPTDASHANGIENASFTGSEDAGYQNLVGTDDSVASDTDPSRPEGPEVALDPTHRRERSNSVKKPASFKAVSVTKNFLAKSGASPSPSTKLGSDRALTGGQTVASAPLALKPRLVAKTGRDARALNAGNGVTNSSGPDASTVWNRNRPVPPPPPKQFTDEELKQQYGIHMATRLQADEAGKESKWADIDDDEDDWAPETVQWMDGTKSTLLPSETQPTPPPKPTGSPQSLQDQSESANAAVQPSQSQSSISSIGKTILRPGARVVAAQSTKPGLILRSVPENPAQPEAPQGNSSSKSPWASLPPVDKASPITFYPPTTSTLQPMSSLRRDPAAQDEEPYVLSPTREIAADDFDRSWREGSERSSRELFNSQSGRYEPVKNVRRSSRQEQGFRPPSVLQRPSQQGPAEPSAAFQSRDSRSWSQRRDSSSRGGYERRVSVDYETRPSAQLAKATTPHASPPKDDASLAIDDSHNNDGTEASVAGQQHAYSAQVPEHGQAPAAPDQDPRLVQQQLMRERIERNRKRKQEEEAREEAERKERIRLKMAALGPVSPSVAQSAPVEAAESETKTFPPSVSESTASNSAKNNSSIQEQSESQTESEALKTTATSESLSKNRSQLSSSKSPVEQGTKGSPSEGSISTANAPEVQLPGLGHPMPTERQARSWGRVPPNLDASANWTNKSLPQGPGSLWGPPTSDRPLGNGAFESEMHRMPSIQLPPNHQIAPGPLRPPSMSPRMQFDAAAHPTPSPPPHMQTSTALSPNIQQRSSFQPAPMRPANDQGFQRQSQQASADMGAAKRAWQNFPTHAANEDATLKEHAERDWAAKLAEEERTGGQSEYHQPVFRETFRQTVSGDVLGQRRIVSVSKAVHDGHNQTSHGQRPSSQALPLQQTANGRASRFFGPNADRLPPVATGHVLDGELLLSAPASPPPPESAEHPVHGAQSSHPMVNIPKVLKVKLPPAAPNASTQRPESAQIPSLVRHRSGHQPIVSQTAWQDRFNGLFNRPAKAAPPVSAAAPTTTTVQSPSPRQPPNVLAAPISASSKAAFDEPWAADSATVSIPQGSEQAKPCGAVFDPAEQEIETKPTEEELVDEREFGSSPTVRLFKGIHPRDEEIVSDCPSFHRGLVGNSQIAYYEKANKDFPASANALSFEYLDSDFFQSSGVRIRIRLCGKPTTMKILPRRVTAQREVRKPKLRTSLPKKQPLPGKGQRSLSGVPSQLQEGSGSSGNKQASASRPSPKLDAQAITKEGRTIADAKRSDAGKGMTASPVSAEQANKSQEGASGEPAAGAQPERSKTSTQWAKPPKSQRRQRPIRA